MKLKTLKCLVIGALLVGAFALIPVGAVSTSDNHKFTFTVGRGGTNLWTGGVQKKDASSVYMHCTTITDYGVSSAAEYSAYVKGSTLLLGTYEDYSHGYVYSFRQGTTRYMYSWVYEELYQEQEQWPIYAGIQGQYTGGSIPLDANGEWRPNT